MKAPKSRRIHIVRALSYCAPALAAAGVPAIAQAQQASGSSGSAVEQIVVTAQRRTQLLEEVPISISAFSAQDLVNADVKDLRNLQTVVPSLQVSSTGVFTQLAIRGITSTALGPGIENNIAVYIDGNYQPDSAALGSDFANVADIQVLKGPQGTLYGRNATGGALLITTQGPSSDKLIANVMAGYGNLNDRRVQGYLGVPLGNGWSFGVGAYYRANDGYIHNVFTNSDGAPFKDVEIRSKLKWEPTSDLTFEAGFNYFYKSDPLNLAYTVVDHALLPALYGLSPSGPLYTTQPDHTALNPNPSFTVKLKESTFHANWKSPVGTFDSHTSYQDEQPFFDNDYDGTAVDFTRIPATFKRHTFEEQLDYNVQPISSLVVQAGVFYFHDRSSDHPFVYTVNPPAIPTYTLYDESNVAMLTKSYAGYIDLSWEVVPHLFLSGGARYTHDDRTVSAYYVSNLFAAFTPGYPILAPPTNIKYNSGTPRANIRYEFAPQTDVYASFSQGFKSGTFNTVATTTAGLTTPVRPEHVTAYEVGFKTAVDNVRFDTAAYYYKYRDLQVTALTTASDGSVLVNLTNAARAKIWGLEASGTWAATSQLNIHAGVAYTHARYASFPAASVTIPGPGGFENTTGTQDFGGKRLARAPDFTANISVDYTMQVGQGDLKFSGNAYYTSKYAPTADDYDPATGDPYYYDKGYAVANIAVAYNWSHYTVRGYVDNITGTRFNILNQASAYGHEVVRSAPTTYGFQLSYAY
jgi:iron complex outermembrane receptor protein